MLQCGEVFMGWGIHLFKSDFRPLIVLNNDDGEHDGHLMTKVIIMRVMLSSNLPLIPV